MLGTRVQGTIGEANESKRQATTFTHDKCAKVPQTCPSRCNYWSGPCSDPAKQISSSLKWKQYQKWVLEIQFSMLSLQGERAHVKQEFDNRRTSLFLQEGLPHKNVQSDSGTSTIST